MISCNFKIQDVDWNKMQGLIPAIVQSAKDHKVLMLGYMNQEALQATLQTGMATFFSRSRQCIWVKGETSGNTLSVESVALDCDSDTILLTVVTNDPCCHRNTTSCFCSSNKETSLEFLIHLEKIIDQRLFQATPESSYVARLAQAGVYEITRKVGEEALEVVLATIEGKNGAIIEETADLLFHMLINLRNKKIRLEEVIHVLMKRHNRR